MKSTFGKKSGRATGRASRKSLPVGGVRSGQKQSAFFKKHNLAYGGELLKTREGRSRGRPIDTKNSMHLVLKSSKARGEYSFRRSQHSRAVQQILKRFSQKYGIRILSFANVGNHLHLHIKISNRAAYRPYIRAITAAIAMAVTGASRWKKSALGKFWDYRPFTRVVIGWRAVLTLRDYIEINKWEGMGLPRIHAETLVAVRKGGKYAGP